MVALSLMQRRLAKVTLTLTHPMGVVMADSGTSSNVYLGMGNGEWECVKQVGRACIFCAVINSACGLLLFIKDNRQDAC